MARTAWLIPVLALAVLGCKGGAGEKATSETMKKSEAVPALTELKKEDVLVGKGATAETGDRVYMLYTGKLANGTVFDSTSTRGDEPFAFTIGAGEVIKGWDQGVPGMKVGGKRKLSIPSSLGYGAEAKGDTIPANSDLYFDVELKEVIKKGDEAVVVRSITKPGTGAVVKEGSTVDIKYSGELMNGTVFDSTDNRNGKYTFKVGDQKVRAFLSEGVTGQRVGSELTLRVPPAVFGPMGGPGVPPGAIVYYKVTILAVK